MIRTLRLERWKAFEQLEQDLPLGTSFIVAENGIGKTSFLQAVQFGLYGDRRLLGSGADVQTAVRGNGQPGRVRLDIELAGAVWRLDRTVPPVDGKKLRRELPAPTVTLNGEPSSEAAWQLAFAAASGASFDYLRLLSGIGEGDTFRADSTSQYDLVQHLSDALGVTRLQAAARSLRAESTSLTKRADSERLEARDRPAKATREEVTALRERLKDALSRTEALEARLEALRTQLDARKRWDSWQQMRLREDALEAQATAELQAVLAEHAVLIQPSRLSTLEALPSPAGLLPALTSLTDEVDVRAQQEAERLGAVRAEAEASRRAIEELARGTAICPTCRRPLMDAEADHARQEHLDVIRSKTDEEEGVVSTVRALDEFRRTLARLTNQMHGLTRTPPPDIPRPGDPVSADDLARLVNDTRTLYESSDADTRDLTAQIRMREEELTRLEADAGLSSHLERQYATADLATVAAGTLERLASALCSEQIAPLATALSKRWLEIWPTRPTVTLDTTTGEVFGDYAGVRLDVSALSGGERTVASLLLRLLALQAASQCPVLLLDEPLEHLDPRNRRLLAGVLVAAGASEAPPRQILVTTYEESVTRRLRGDAGGRSNVIYIRSDARPEGPATGGITP